MSTPSIPEPSPRARGSGCPLCGKASAAVASPFCGPGCRDRDLLQWLGDGYRVPGPPVGEDELGAAGSGLDSGARPPL